MTITRPLAVISDIHGCYKTLMALVAKIPYTHQVVLGGDLVDRGPDSRGVLNWAMDNLVPSVMGNHEDLMLGYHSPRFPCCREGLGYWMVNGGGDTLDSFGGDIPDDVLQWVNKLPFHIDAEYDGNKFEISHTGFGGCNTSRTVKLWTRYGSDVWGLPPGEQFRIFGHTQKQEPWIEKDFAMIDTGCAYKDRGMGKLTAFLIPEKQVIQQDNID